MSTDPTELADAEHLGAVAYREDKLINVCPFTVAQGSPTRILAIAWRRGFRQAQSAAEISEQEAAGHFKSTS